MRRFMAVALAMVVVFCTIGMPARAASRNSRNAMDLVIVIDASESMDTNDKNHYRLGAAGLMLSMLDEQYSNAGVVIIGKNIVTDVNQFNKMYSMTNLENRKSLLDKVLGFTRTFRGTNIGAGLHQAMTMLGEKSKSGNEQVILLLTDGEIAQELEDDMGRRITVEDSEKMAMDAIDEAIQKNIRIHTVYLHDKEREHDRRLLDEMAIRTGANEDGCIEVSKNDELIQVFNEVFAGQIGSALNTIRSSGIETDPNSGVKYVNIDVPNRSIQEINLVISKDTRENNTVEIFDASGNNQPMPVDNKRLFKFETYWHFVYKIVNPEPSTPDRKWRINLGKNPGNISVQYVFSYDIDSEAWLGKTVQAKSDHLDIEAQFTKNGIPSSDDALYSSIEATAGFYKLKDGKGKFIGSIPMERKLVNNTWEYYQDCDLKTILGNEYGQGDYYILVHFEGAGLSRDSERMPLTLTNEAPVARKALKDMTFVYNVQNQGEEDTGVIQIPLDEYVQDPNQDPISYELVYVPDNLSVEIRGNELIVNQKKTSLNDKIEIRAFDNDGGDYLLEQNVIVKDMSDQYADYDLELMLENAEMDNISGLYNLRKGQTVEVLVQATDANGNLPDATILEHLGQPSVQYGKTIIPMQETSRGQFRGSFTADDVVTEYRINAMISYGDKEAGRKAKSISAQVVNYAPEVKKDLNADLTDILSRQGGGSLVSMFGGAEEQTYWIDQFLPLDHKTGDVILDLEDYFEDKNLTDGEEETLTYSVRMDKQDRDLTQYLQDGHVLIINEELLRGDSDQIWNNQEFRFTVLCRDKDGETARQDAFLIVCSIKSREIRVCIYLLISLAILLLIAMLIRYLLLPVYKRGMKLQLYFGNIKQPVEQNLPSRGGAAKRKRLLSSFYDSSIDTRTNGAVTIDMFKKIVLTPASGNRIKVILDKKASGALNVTVGERELLRGKSQYLNTGERITVTTDSTRVIVSYELQQI